MATLADVDGVVTNDYTTDRSVGVMPPSTPWALYLSGDRERFDYLVFDLDSKNGNAPVDAGRFSMWLADEEIAHLVAESGPTGGRHVWITLAEPTAAATVLEIAKLAKSLFPSLDITPLTNAATGCVRPPGAIHRYGGTSRPISSLAMLDRPLDSDGVRRLRQLLLERGAELPADTPTVGHNLELDEDAHPFVLGERRALSPDVTLLLHEPLAAGEDASFRMARVLAGMANAHWQLRDVLPHVATAPAFEHVRTMPHRGTRIPKPAKQGEAILTRAWRHAVEFAATNPPSTSTSAAVEGLDYIERLTHVLAAVEALQERANAMPGLWGGDRASQSARTRRGTYSRRAALDALCLLMIQAARTNIEADCRRIGEHIGYGKTVASEALRELSTPLIEGDEESSWIVKDGSPEQGRGQRYRLSKRFSTEDHSSDRTIVIPSPPPSPLGTRDWWIRELGAKLRVLQLDVFSAPGSLGRHAANVFLQLPQLEYEMPLKVTEAGEVVQDLPALSIGAGADIASIVLRSGLTLARVRIELDKLARVWLAVPRTVGWSRPPMNDDGMKGLALHLDVFGYLEARRLRHQFERERWGQWLKEVHQHEHPHAAPRRRPRRPHETAVPLPGQYDAYMQRPRYPKKPNGDADHARALRLIAARHVA